MRTLNKQILIFSTYQSTHPEVLNSMNHSNTMKLLKSRGVPFKELVGVYDGTQEKSILVPVKYRGTVESLCDKYSQECYLESHSDRFCELIYPDGSKVGIGTLREMSTEEVLEIDNYTYDPSTDKYWGTV